MEQCIIRFGLWEDIKVHILTFMVYFIICAIWTWALGEILPEKYKPWTSVIAITIMVTFYFLLTGRN